MNGVVMMISLSKISVFSSRKSVVFEVFCARRFASSLSKTIIAVFSLFLIETLISLFSFRISVFIVSKFSTKTSSPVLKEVFEVFMPKRLLA